MASRLLPDPPTSSLSVTRQPGEDIPMPGLGPGGRAPGEGGGEAPPPGRQVGLEAEAGAGGRVLLTPSVAASHRSHGSALHTGQVVLLCLGDAPTPNWTCVRQ